MAIPAFPPSSTRRVPVRRGNDRSQLNFNKVLARTLDLAPADPPSIKLAYLDRRSTSDRGFTPPSHCLVQVSGF